RLLDSGVPRRRVLGRNRDSRERARLRCGRLGRGAHQRGFDQGVAASGPRAARDVVEGVGEGEDASMTEAWDLLEMLLGLDRDVSDVNIGQMALRALLIYGAA